MEHISNMGYSLDAIRFLVELQIAKWLPSVDIYYQETYPFCNRIEYEKEVKKYLIKHSTETLNKILTQHLLTCEQIIQVWDERRELWDARSLLTAGRKNDVDDNISYEIYCTLGGREKNFQHFYGDILLLRINNEKVEKGNPYTWLDMSWREYNPKLRPTSNTYMKTLPVYLVRRVELVRRFLSEYVSDIKSVPTTEQSEQTALKTDIEKELYFTRPFTDTERRKLFDGLISGGFIPKDTNYNHFSFVFGGTQTDDFEPLRWTDKVALLAYFIDNGFADTDGTNYWRITEACFTIKSVKPNIDSLKNVVSKYRNNYKEKPKDYKRIDNILSSL